MTAFLSKLQSLIDDFAARYDEAATLEWVRALWQSDRWSDYTAFHRTARYVAEELRKLGVQDVQIVPCPADGRTRVQAWTMPLAWEAGTAVLKAVSPVEQVVCDRAIEPLSCVMWCEPTPPGGVRGPLVVVDDIAGVTPEQRQALRGAFLLTSLPARGAMKVFACEVGAAAVVSSFVAHGERHGDKAVFWTNAWADDEGGWALKASDRRMAAFNISNQTAVRLRRLVANAPVVCEAVVGGRIGEGTLPIVVGVLPGQTDEEVLLNGHLYEIGANDNASGTGAILEAARLMAAMDRPRRRVRLQFTSECYGTYAYYTARPELLKRTVAGLNVDGVGERQTERWRQPWYRTPMAAPSAVDTLMRAAFRLTEPLPGCLAVEERAHGLSDNVLCDPAAGVPMPTIMQAPWTWHTNLDDWTQLDPRSIRRGTVAVTAFVRWLAEAGPADADALAADAAAEAVASLGEVADERRAFIADRARAAVLWTERLGATQAAAAARPLEAIDLASLVSEADGGEDERHTVPVRRFWGAPTFDEIPLADREGLADPRWNGPLTAATYWADGRRSIAEIAALIRTEFGRPAADRVARLFRVLQRGGLVSLERRP
ncbi:MAG: DUF4910 domain-containing protein [Planctomycetes bacterium]|nr:DUF4910 domain-containing protein [Planctomycetota bacterium]